MKKYILGSSLTCLLFPLVMIYPLFFMSLFVPNPLFVFTKFTGVTSGGFGVAILLWIIVGAIIGSALYILRQKTSKKENLEPLSFGFAGILLTILIQLLIATALSYLV